MVYTAPESTGPESVPESARAARAVSAATTPNARLNTMTTASTRDSALFIGYLSFLISPLYAVCKICIPSACIAENEILTT